MSQDPRTAVARRNEMLALLGSTLDGGFLKIYNGAKPANADTAITTQSLLATLGFGSPAFGTPSGGSVAANPISPGTIATTGTASWFRMFESDGVTVVGDGTVDTTGADMNVNSNEFRIGAQAACTSFVLSMPT